MDKDMSSTRTTNVQHQKVHMVKTAKKPGRRFCPLEVCLEALSNIALFPAVSIPP